MSESANEPEPPATNGDNSNSNNNPSTGNNTNEGNNDSSNSSNNNNNNASGNAASNGSSNQTPPAGTQNSSTHPATEAKPSSEQKPDTPETTTTKAKTLTKGRVVTSDNKKCKIKILSDKTAAYVAPANKKAKTISVPNTIKANGTSYKIVKIADKAFANQKNLKSVTIGKNVTSIGKNAFLNDKNLKKITIKSVKLKKTSIGKNALKGTNKKLVIKVPKKQVSNYKKFFKGKGNSFVKVQK